MDEITRSNVKQIAIDKWIYLANKIVIDKGRRELKNWLELHPRIAKSIKSSRKDMRFGDELIMALEEMKDAGC